MIFPQNVGTHEFFQEHILRAVGLLTVSSFKMLWEEKGFALSLFRKE